MLSERLSDTKLYKAARPDGTETRRLDDRSKWVRDVRDKRGVIGINVKAFSAKLRYRNDSHLRDGRRASVGVGVFSAVGVD